MSTRHHNTHLSIYIFLRPEKPLPESVNIPMSHNSSGWHRSLKRYLNRNKIKLLVSLCFKLTNCFDDDSCDAIRWVEHFEYNLASKVYFIYLTCFIQLLLLKPDHPHDLNALDLQDETGIDSARPLNSQVPNILLQFSSPPTEYPTTTFTQRILRSPLLRPPS